MAVPAAPYVFLREAGERLGSPWYQKAVTALWDAGLATGVDPLVLAAQCALETNWGRFGGAVTEQFGNTCGLKNRSAAGDLPDDHARFATDVYGYPRLGALAHAHHLRLYCGFPVPDDSPDPRAVWIRPGSATYGSVDYVEDLGGRWAPAPDYGVRVVKVIERIMNGT